MTLRSILSRLLPLVALCAASAGISHAQTAFKAGDLVIYRVGTTGSPTALSSAATAVYLDEYTPTGTLVQSIAMPTADSGSMHILTASGSATSEGMLNLSSDGKYLALTGYDAAVGTAGVASTSTTSATPTARVVGIVSGNGTVDTSTALLSSGISGNNIRGAYTTNGTNIYVADANNGIDYTTIGSTGTSAPTALSTTVTNARDVVVSNGQLYGSTGSGTTYRVFSIGTGTPTTSGQTITELPGTIPTTAAFSPYAFSFATLNTGNTSPDTLYIADNTAGAIDKFSLISGNWTASGTITGLSGVTGLTESFVGGTVSLYATTPTSFYGITDTTGFNGTLSGTASLLASAGTNTAFRGIAFAPQVASGSASAPEPAVLSLLAEAGLLGAGYLRLRKRRTAK